MKKTRKIAAMIAAMAMTATMAVPSVMMSASAAPDESAAVVSEGTGEQNFTITFDQTNGTNTDKTYTGDEATHKYGAYQIFKGTLTEKPVSAESNSEIQKILSDIDWGSGVDFTKAGKDLASLVAALKADEAVTVFSSITAEGKQDKEVAQDIAKALQNVTDDSEAAIFFAKTIAGYLSGQKEQSGANGTITIPETAAGYYLIQDEEVPDNGAKTRYILSVVDSVTVKAKASAPTVIKKVKENNSDNFAEEDAKIGDTTVDPANTGYNDVADYSIGDAVPFKLYGTLPDANTYNDFNAYYYKFTDTLGSEFDQPETVKVKAGSAELRFTKNTTNPAQYVLDASSQNTLAEGVTAATGDVIVSWDANAGKLEIVFENIKDYIATIPATAPVITVEYDAVLNTTAAIGLSGQENAVVLNYSSNPNVTWTPTKNDQPDTPPENEDTPEDRVIVFTYELDINKVDENDNKLANAVFIVKALNGDHEGKYVTVDQNNRVSGWLDTAPTDQNAGKTAGVFTSAAEGNIQIIGLDDGQYEITELAPPAGYNPLSAPKTWTIEASTDNTQAWNVFAPAVALTNIDLKEGDASIDQKHDENNGIVEGKIENKSGSTLPSTGGMGTKLFIAGGGLTAVLAGVYLVSKKRTKEEDAQ